MDRTPFDGEDEMVNEFHLEGLLDEIDQSNLGGILIKPIGRSVNRGLSSHRL